MKGIQPPKRPFVNPVTAVRDGGCKAPCEFRTSNSPADCLSGSKTWGIRASRTVRADDLMPAVSDGQTGYETHRKLHAPHPFAGLKM